MNNIFKCVLLLLCLVVSSCKNYSVRGDDLVSDELCGEALYGENPCAYVKEIGVPLDGHLLRRELFNAYSQYLSDRVADMNEEFSYLDVNVKFKPFYSSAWFQRPKKNDSNIEVAFLLTETPDKKFILMTFYTFSREPFHISSYQCPIGESSCVVDNMKKIIDEKIVKSITADGR